MPILAYIHVINLRYPSDAAFFFFFFFFFFLFFLPSILTLVIL